MKNRSSPRYCKDDEFFIDVTGFSGKTKNKVESKPGDLPRAECERYFRWENCGWQNALRSVGFILLFRQPFDRTVAFIFSKEVPL